MNRINCDQCGAKYVGQCACPKTLRVTSGSHSVKINWMQGCFVAVSADEASTVSESQAKYLRGWPYSNYTFTPVIHAYSPYEILASSGIADPFEIPLMFTGESEGGCECEAHQ